MRTSRNAWGSSINTHDAVMEWELGSRAMEHIEAENTPVLGLAAVRLRASRAQVRIEDPFGEGTMYLDHLVTVKGRPDELYFCYDVAEDGRLMCTIIDPPLPDGAGDFTLIPPEMVEDSTPWVQAKEDSDERTEAV